MKKDYDDVEHYDCHGNYIGPPEPLPKNMEILARTMKEYAEWPDDENEPEDAFYKLYLRKTREVEALFPQYRYDGPNMINANPYAPCPAVPDIQTVEPDDTSSETSEDLVLMEESSSSESPEYDIPEDSSDDDSCGLPVPEVKEALPVKKLPENSAIYNLHNLNAALVVPADQKWTDLCEFGHKIAVATKFMGGKEDLTGPIAMYYSAGAMELKKKLLESPEGYREAVDNILASQMVDYIVQGEAAKAVMLTSENPFGDLYMRMLGVKKQMDGQVVKIMESKHKLTSLPIKIKHASQVNVSGIQQVNNNDQKQG